MVVSGSSAASTTTPLLSALGSFGGPLAGAYRTAVLTQVPLPPSPMLASGCITASCINSVTTDSRGLPRIVNGTIDIGAVESNYSLAYVKQPINVEVGASKIAPVQLYESGKLFSPRVATGRLALTSAASQSSATIAMSASRLETINAKYSAVATNDQRGRGHHRGLRLCACAVHVRDCSGWH